MGKSYIGNIIVFRGSNISCSLACTDTFSWVRSDDQGEQPLSLRSTVAHRYHILVHNTTHMAIHLPFSVKRCMTALEDRNSVNVGL